MDIGNYIRQEVIPDGMSVTEAAKKLGVGRPALSNLLNSRASLSPTMALRLEQAFGADRQELLDRQTQATSVRASEKAGGIAVPAYAPPFLSEPITARRISEWATGNIAARDQLPVLLRRLINSTGRDLQRVDFPDGDSAQQPDWDGRVEADAATPWIPQGHSGWELSTTQHPAAKANRDYRGRLGIDPVERAQWTFVFVTTTNWWNKNNWAEQKETLGHWKAVRAYDASDLEQWLEASVSGQLWLAEKMGIPTEGVETLAQSWDRWADASEPKMTPKIFEPSLDAHRDRFNEWLDKEAGERPLAVAADSRNEALAFLACLFSDSSVLGCHRDRAAVFESAQSLRKVASSSLPLIPISYSDEVEREFATLYRERHCIVVQPRNSVGREPDITVELLGHEAFEASLTDMGIEPTESDRWSRESGRSPTVLRRRLSIIPAISRPKWAIDSATAQSLIPIVLVGAWHKESKADCEVLSALADGEYEVIEETVARLLHIEDCPVWSVGQYRGAVSKIDALFAISGTLIGRHLEEFFWIAEYVLSESDPALDLPSHDRFAAGIFGKVRDHSTTLRTGVCETLVLLSVHGNYLFQDRLGIDIEAWVSDLVRRLLTPLTLETLLLQDDDLPRYAEAAPSEFLNIVETDLQQRDPILREILKPVDSSMFLGCPRAGLLWALECLAWNPRYLGRVTDILADLSKTEINDNWSNKPIASLEAIYRSWLPQTAAPIEDRIRGLIMLANRFPKTGWHICMEQFGPGQQIGGYSYRLRWRAEATGAGHVVTHQERYLFARKALDLALAWPSGHDSVKLGDLIERLEVMADEDKTRVWNLVDTWAESEDDETAKARLRERIRRFALAWPGDSRSQEFREMAQAAYAKLTPLDVVNRHSWLFESEWMDVPAEEWVNESADDNLDEKYDHEKHDEWIHKQRTNAISEIWEERGFEGIACLVAKSNAAHVVGRYTARCATSLQVAGSVLQGCLAVRADPRERVRAFMHGFIWYAVEREGSQLLTEVSGTSSEDQKVRLFTCAPYGSETWRLLDHETPQLRERYWRDVRPHRNRLSEAEINESVDRLLDVERPWAAFRAVEWDWKKIETSRLKRLLVMTATSIQEADYTPKPNSYHIAHALKSLSVRADVSSDDMAKLEFLYIDVLRHENEYGIPNLERQITASPNLFVQAIALCYKRSDEGQDPFDWQIQDPEQRSAAVMSAYRLLDGISRIPGSADESDDVDLEQLRDWVAQVRRLCAEHSRLDIGDQRIGQLLAKAPVGADGQWPCRAVCEVMQQVHSEYVARGFHLGVYNSRGMHVRGEGGDQERELAAKYRSWARQHDFEYPYVSRVLEDIAKTYDKEATQQDSEASVRRRLIL